MREIKRSDSQARLIVVTSMSGDEDVFRAVQAGASGYLLKDCGREELIQCVRAVLRGQKYMQMFAAGLLAERVLHDPLTARESVVLQALADGLSNKAVARRLNIAEGTVKTHVKAVLEKLGALSRTDAVRIAVERGLVDRGRAWR
jgi:two-component system, NarL family, response regulator